MSEKPGLPDLDQFIAASRHGPHRACSYVASTTAEQRAAIRAKVDQGVHAWAAYLRWLHAQGAMTTHSALVGHFDRGHNDDTCH